MSVIYRVVTTSLIVLFCRLALITAIAAGNDDLPDALVHKNVAVFTLNV